MKTFVAAIALASVMAHAASAQEDEGSSLMERGAQQFFDGLLQEMEPAWQQMRGFMDEMGPAMLELMDQIKDWSVYAPPEVLDNGDIIIRRKPPEEVTPLPDAEPAPQIEL